jgi:NAD(P)-dependent dehydrogenase (short-subunit alcohol dehydrogenase family)
MSELRFDDQVAIVTGAGRGIGRAHARLLAARGARVVVADVGGGIDGLGESAAPAQEVVDEIENHGGHAVPCFASVADQSGAAQIVQVAIDTYGRVDIVVNNAGIHDPGPFDALSVEQFQRMIAVHFLGTLFVTRAAWPHFRAAGCGRIVNTVSEAMLGGIPELTSYGAAKGAVFGLMRNLALEGESLGIKANAIAPRAFTRMSASGSDSLADALGLPREVMDQINASMPPEMCAPAVAYLAHRSCPLNGEVLQVGMGGVARLAVVRTRGIAKPDMTPEDIADNIDAILDVTDAEVTSSALAIGG